MPCTPSLALGDQRHLVAVGIGQRLRRGQSLARDLEADDARRRRRGQRDAREWFIFRIEPFM